MRFGHAPSSMTHGTSLRSTRFRHTASGYQGHVMTTTTPRGRQTSDRWFHDANGDLAVWQRPNLPLMVWGAARLLELFVRHGRPTRLLDAIGFGALFVWSWLELFDGSAYIR